MRQYLQFHVLLAFTLFFASCGPKKNVEVGDTITLGFQNDEVVSQKSENIEKVRRIYLSIETYGENKVLGSEVVDGYELVNVNSLPDKLKNKYYGIFALDRHGQILYKSLMDKSSYFSDDLDHSDYWVMNYKFSGFIDIPLSLDTKEIATLAFADLNTNKINRKFNIEDIDKHYIPENENIEEDGWNGEYKVYKLYGESKSEDAFDFVILVDGFTKEELQMETKESIINSKFGVFYKKHIETLLNDEPFKSLSHMINFWVVATPSKDSGVSNPMDNIKKRTVLSSSFGAYCSRRSLKVLNELRALELASKVPFDQVIVLANSETYGGQGSTIATFTMNKNSEYIFKHELLHSIALFADEYSSFVDRNNVFSEEQKIQRDQELSEAGVSDEATVCEDILVTHEIRHKHKNWGGNRFFENDRELAHNLSNTSDPGEVKWKYFLNENSPVVFFDYAIGGYKIDLISGEPEIISMSAVFEIVKEREELLITFGIDQRQNKLLELVNNLKINDSLVEFELFKNNEQRFVRVKNFEFNTGDKLKFYFELPVPQEDSDEYNGLGMSLSDQHFFSLPNRTFSGGLEMGIFQGAKVDMKRTFRSSYDNIMATHNLKLNKYQEAVYRQIIRYFSGTLNQ